MSDAEGYVTGRRLGQGSTAAVFVARGGDGRDVVIKRAHATERARVALDHEAQVLELLDRAGAGGVIRLVDRLDPAPASGGPSLVLHPLGTPLATLVDGHALLDAPAKVRVIADVAMGLASAHAAGITHNDVSLANVVVDPTGRAVLIDFAAATRTGAVAPLAGATPPFVAPERLRGEPGSAAADVCALGLLGFHLWLGRVPPRRRAAELVAQGCPASVATLLTAAASDEPIARPSAAQLLDGLDRSAPGRHRPLPPGVPGRIPSALPATREFGPRPPRPAVATPPTFAAASGRGPRRVAVAIAAAGLLALGATSVVLRTDEEPSRAGSSEQPLDVVWDAARAEASVATAAGIKRYRVGQPGDQLVVGDWEGDGTPTPAVFRPSTGDLFVFHAWATAREPAPSGTGLPTGIIGGHPVVRHRDGRDVIEVRP